MSSETIISINEDSGSSKLRKSNTVYHSVKRSILLRERQSGEALLEQGIAKSLGCSQGTVREALLRLQDDGLVARRGYRGTVVSETTLQEAAYLSQIRIRLESQGAHLAAKLATPADLEHIDGLLDQMDNAQVIGDSYELSELDRELHLAIFRLSGLKVLEPVLTRSALHMHRYTFGNAPPAVDRTPVPSVEHRVILDFLRQRDGKGAAKAVRSHIEQVLERWSPTLCQAMHDSLEVDPFAGEV